MWRESYSPEYWGSPTPIEVLNARHKEGVPAVSYGIFRQKQCLKVEYSGMNISALDAVLRANDRDRGDENDLS